MTDKTYEPGAERATTHDCLEPADLITFPAAPLGLGAFEAFRERAYDAPQAPLSPFTREDRTPRPTPHCKTTEFMSETSVPNGQKSGVWGEDVEPEPASNRLLLRTIERDVIPRLLAAHLAERGATAAAPSLKAPRTETPRTETPPPGGGDRPSPYREADIEALVEACFTLEPAALIGEIERLGPPHASTEDVFLRLLAPAARRLGQLWEEDLCSFADVAIGLCRLHAVVRALSPRFEGEGPERPDMGAPTRSAAARLRVGVALVAPAPGEDHSFGAALASAFLRRAGWSVSLETPDSIEALRRLTVERAVDLVGLSASADHQLPALGRAIAALRADGSGPAILLGGRLFSGPPAQAQALAASLGADAVATGADDGPAAAARALVSAQARRRARAIVGDEPAP